MKSVKCKLLLFDLDGTLLRSDKTISKVTMQEVLYRQRKRMEILYGMEEIVCNAHFGERI